jgi:hypothetical protein
MCTLATSTLHVSAQICVLLPLKVNHNLQTTLKLSEHGFKEESCVCIDFSYVLCALCECSSEVPCASVIVKYFV